MIDANVMNGLNRCRNLMACLMALSISGCVNTGGALCGGTITASELAVAEQAIVEFNTRTWGEYHGETFFERNKLETVDRCGGSIRLKYSIIQPDNPRIAILGGANMYKVNRTTGKVLWISLGD